MVGFCVRVVGVATGGGGRRKWQRRGRGRGMIKKKMVKRSNRMTRKWRMMGRMGKNRMLE